MKIIHEIKEIKTLLSTLLKRALCNNVKSKIFLKYILNDYFFIFCLALKFNYLQFIYNYFDVLTNIKHV